MCVCLLGSKPHKCTHPTIIHHKFPIWAIFSHPSWPGSHKGTSTQLTKRWYSSSRTIALMPFHTCVCVCEWRCIYFAVSVTHIQNATSEWHITKIISAISRHASLSLSPFVPLLLCKASVLSVVHRSVHVLFITRNTWSWIDSSKWNRFTGEKWKINQNSRPFIWLERMVSLEIRVTNRGRTLNWRIFRLNNKFNEIPTTSDDDDGDDDYEMMSVR